MTKGKFALGCLVILLLPVIGILGIVVYGGLTTPRGDDDDSDESLEEEPSPRPQ